MEDKNTIEALKQQFGNKCYFCGVEAPLLLHHLVPPNDGGEDSIDNLRLVCGKCNVRVSNKDFHEIRGFDFENYLSQILQASKDFRNVKAQDGSGDIGIDITAEEIIDDNWQPTFIECKALSSFTKSRFLGTIEQIKLTKERLGKKRLIFAFLGESDEIMKDFALRNGFEVWDISYIAQRFDQEIKRIYHPILQAMFLSINVAPESPGSKLIRELGLLRPGREDCMQYQDLIKRIFERLFCPPLAVPITEFSDSLGVNRRDIIIPNYADEGFWKYIRSRYSAEYIVIDTKNYNENITKQSVLQVANYLKRRGAGLFGIIVCREGVGIGCTHTVKEVWGDSKKMIVILTDEDIVNMLTEKASNRNPEVMIRQKIEDFRLSL